VVVLVGVLDVVIGIAVFLVFRFEKGSAVVGVNIVAWLGK
jgi:hypothetical protein